jgi:hypothetical protein
MTKGNSLLGLKLKVPKLNYIIIYHHLPLTFIHMVVNALSPPPPKNPSPLFFAPLPNYDKNPNLTLKH